MKHKTRKKIVLRQRRSVTFGSLEPAQHEKVRRWILNTLRIVPVLSDLDEMILNFLGIDLDKPEDRTVAQESGGRSDVESKVDALTEMLLSKKERGDDSKLRMRLNELSDRIGKSPLPKDRTTLKKNLDRLQGAMGLSDTERELLEFAVLLDLNEALQNTTDLLGSELNSRQVMEALSLILERPFEEIRYAFSNESPLGGSAILSLDRRNTHWLKAKIDFISNSLPDRLHSEEASIEELLGEIIHPAPPSSLSLKDYGHLRKGMEMLQEYLDDSLRRGRKGVNILLYGPPGTGKTELARLMARRLDARLYEVSSQDDSGDSMDGTKRLRSYRGAQALLNRGRNLLPYDEAEDIFESYRGFFSSKRQREKAWFNRTLENNPVPTFWITNRIEALDPAIVRRFDLSLELAILPRKFRRKIIRRYCGELLDAKTIKRLSRHPFIAPALVVSAAKVARRLPKARRGKELLNIIDRTLKAQGNPPLKHYMKKRKKDKEPKNRLPSLYDPALANAATEPKALAEGLKRNPNARLCLYGPPGTGKSAYGLWLAKELGRPVLLKKGSDLLSMWVGGTEKNIAAAFAEAKKKKAVLIFDEVDSLLQDRRDAQRSWEVTQVNEMLVQMEEFNGIFIATTNLMEGLDQASLRRFDLKLEFGYMKPEQIEALFRKSCKELKIGEPFEKEVTRLRRLVNLTPGDFAAVMR